MGVNAVHESAGEHRGGDQREEQRTLLVLQAPALPVGVDTDRQQGEQRQHRQHEGGIEIRRSYRNRAQLQRFGDKRRQRAREHRGGANKQRPEPLSEVPRILIENAKIASSNVQLLNRPRLSVTASECTSAVPISHGMNEAFSTGSQNQKPPQPSS